MRFLIGKGNSRAQTRAAEQEKIQEECNRNSSAAASSTTDSSKHDELGTTNGGENPATPLAKDLPASNSDDVNKQENCGEQAPDVVENPSVEPPVSTSEISLNDDTQQEPQKDVLIDAEYIRAMYEAILENSKRAKDATDGFKTLASLIADLNANTITQLGTTAAQLETASEELARLKTEEGERIRAGDVLSRENAKLKDKCEEYDGIIADKDVQISQAIEGLNVEKEKCVAKEVEIAGLNKALHDANITHADEIAKLKSAHEAEMADLEKKHGEEVDALKSNAAEKIEAVRKSVNDFVPADVCDLFDYRVGEPVDDRSRWQAIYAYLGFINGNLRQDAFAKRFREFDAALYDAMRDTPDQLADCRVRVQRHINDVIGKKSGGLLVNWPKVGEACNPDQYTTTSDFGQRISEVISAMIYKKGDDGKVLCQSKGKVATA